MGEDFDGRVSSDEQREGHTIETQRAAWARWCAASPHVEPVGEYLDDGVSGTVPLEERPAGAELLALARARGLDAVAVYKMDRLGRDEWGRIIVNGVYDLDRLGVAVISITEPVDTSTPMGRFMLSILAGMAGMERSTLLQRSRDGTDHWAREGVWLGGIVPYGYRLEGSKKTARLAVSEALLPGLELSEAGVVRLIFRLAADEGWTTVRIADHLNALGVPTSYVKDGREVQYRDAAGKRRARTAGVWYPGRVRNLLVSTTYKGVHVYGKRSKHGRELITRPVPAIVDPDTWERAQQTLQRNRLLAAWNTVRRYLLRGLIRCGVCGLTYHGTMSRVRGEDRAYYVCGGRTAYRGKYRGRCWSRMVRADWLEGAVWADIEGFLREPGEVLRELGQQHGDVQERRAVAEAEREAIAGHLGRKQEERDAILDLYRRRLITGQDLERQLAKIAREEQEVRARLEELEEAVRLAELIEERLQSAAQLLEELRGHLDEGLDWETRRRIVELLVLEVRVETEREGRRAGGRTVVTYTFDREPRVLGDCAVDGTGTRVRSRATLTRVYEAPPG